MPSASECVRFHVDGAAAVLTLTDAEYRGGGFKWRGVVRVDGEAHRYFGCARPTLHAATEQVLQRFFSDTVAVDEVARVLSAVDSMAGRSAGSQPSALVPMAPVPTCAPRGPGTSMDIDDPCVAWVHQIYGVFRDGKAMPPLFQRSQQRWRQVATDMGAEYHLWSADELDSLVKQQYPASWRMYVDARYPVMRVDIGRVAILHAYGGMYADMDTMPNRSRYSQTLLSVGRVQLSKRIPSRARVKLSKGRLPAKAKPKPASQRSYALEMEVLIATKGNSVLLRWLDHMREEIETKDYVTVASFWHNARMRYIWHTTGPRSMSRFFKRDENVQVRRSLKYLHANYFKDCSTLTAAQRRMLDYVSYESNSYFTDAPRIHTDVGHGEEQLPPMPVRMRMCAKRSLPRYRAANSESRKGLAHSQEGLADSQEIEPAEKKEPASSSTAVQTQDLPEVVSAAVQTQDLPEVVSAAVQTRDLPNLERDARLAVLESEHARVKRQFHDTELRVDDLRSYIKARRTVSTKVFMQDMPKDLRAWLTTKARAQ